MCFMIINALWKSCYFMGIFFSLCFIKFEFVVVISLPWNDKVLSASTTLFRNLNMRRKFCFRITSIWALYYLKYLQQCVVWQLKLYMTLNRSIITPSIWRHCGVKSIKSQRWSNCNIFNSIHYDSKITVT